MAEERDTIQTEQPVRTDPPVQGEQAGGWVTADVEPLTAGTRLVMAPMPEPRMPRARPRESLRGYISRTGREVAAGMVRKKERASGLKKVGTELLNTKEGRKLFEEVFGRGVWDKRYTVPKKAATCVSKERLGEMARGLMGRGMSPRMLLEFIEGVSDPDRLHRVLENMYFANSERNPCYMREVASSTEEMERDWFRYMEWGNPEGSGSDQRPPVKVGRMWVVAVWRRVAPEYKRGLRRIIRGSNETCAVDVWARLPRAEVRRIVRLWLEGEVWVRNFNGRDELEKKLLTWAYLRMKYLPEYPSSDIRGIVDVSALRKRTDEYMGHYEDGHSTTQTGYNNLVQYCKERRKTGCTAIQIKRMVAMMLEDEDELTKKKEVGIMTVTKEGKAVRSETIKKPTWEGELSSERARQVLVFRIARGVVLWMDKTKRIVQIGPDTNVFSWRVGELSNHFPITIIAASTLGYKEGVWGWTTIIDSATLAMVVPDIHWDAMIQMWEVGYVMWPNLIEAGGMPGYVQRLPLWNGRIGDHCFGGGNLSVYPMGGKRGTSSEVSRRGGNKAVRFWEQPRVACMMQDGSFSWEAMHGGTIRVYVPLWEFHGRMLELTAHLKKEAWGKGLPVDVEFAIVTQSVRRILQMICQYGERDVSWWQHPVCGTKSQMWWWLRTNMGAFHTESGEGYVPLRDMEKKMADLNILGPRVWNPLAVERKDGAWRPKKMLCSREIWEMGYLPIKIAVDGSRGLCEWKDAADRDKTGEHLGDSRKWVVPPRIQGTTPDTKQEIARASILKDELRAVGSFPYCRVLTCTNPNCNDEGGINDHPRHEVARPRWDLVPTKYIEWTKN